MAAQHLAAIKIQGAIRRFLYRQRRRQGLGGVLTGVYAQWQERRLLQDKKNLQMQINLMASQMNQQSPAKRGQAKQWDYRDEMKYQ